ncbi:MAG TPA: GNAT family N-acetyltransferase [Herpetosiphonaceae bacterium]
MSEFERTRGRFTVSTDRALLDVAAIHAFLSGSAYWALGRPLALVERSIANSALCFGLYDGAAQIGFARVISDLTTFAYLGDVYVLDAYRGQGLGVWLIESVLAHPDLRDLRRFILMTKDAHGLYARFGFGPPADPEKHMQRLIEPAPPPAE